MKKPNSKNRSAKINWLEQLAKGLNVPTEVTSNVPMIKLIGNKEISIENFINLVEYTPQKVRLSTKSGLLIIDGIALEAKQMTSEQILIRGTILQVAFAI